MYFWGFIFFGLSTNKGCGAKSQIANGNIVYGNSNYGATARVVCDPGYRPTRNLTHGGVRCLPNDAVLIVADCIPPTFQNAAFTPVQTSYADGATVTFTCKDGYELDGRRIHTCRGSSWEGSLTCHEQFCETITTPRNGRIVGNPSYKIATYITFECNSGYTLNGNTQLLCRVDLKFDGNPPTCDVKMCPNFGVIDHARIFQATDGGIENDYGSVVKVTCEDSYVLDGTAHVVCQADGTWGSKPTCKPLDCGTFDGKNSNCIKSNILFETLYYIECETDVPNTRIGGPSTSTPNECLGSQQWEYSVFGCFCHCKLMYNKTVLTVHLDTDDYLPHDGELQNSQWSCSKGCTKNTNNPLKCKDGQMEMPSCTCDPDVEPFTPSPDDQPGNNDMISASIGAVNGYLIHCPSQQKIENGRLITEGLTSYGSIASVICDPGFRVFENLTKGGVKCLPHGKWETVQCEQNNEQKVDNSNTVPVLVQCLHNTDSNGVWPSVDAGTVQKKHCMEGYNGIITRTCNASGYYEKPVYNCTKQAIHALFNKVKDNMSSNVTESIEDLRKEIRVGLEDNNTSSGDKTTLHVGDIETATEIMKLITERFEANTSAIENVTDSFVDVVDNLISNRTTNAWGALMDKGGAAGVINVLDDFIAKVVNNSAVSKQNLTIRKENIFLEIGYVEQCSKITFPDSGKKRNVPEWAMTRYDTVEVACRGTGGMTFSGSFFRNMTSIMSSKTKDSRHMEINAPVLAFSVQDSITSPDAQNVTLVFKLFNTDLTTPSCSFWIKGNASVEGHWSNDGCKLVEYNQQAGRVTCSCNHLTNFAVLMSPGVNIEKIHHQALSAITVVGCCLSLAGLVTTSVIYVCCWRMVKSNRATLLLNLCGALFVAYLSFLIGIKRTQPMSACTFTAVLLHYVYLVAFFLMLAEGGVIALMVLSPLTKRDIISYFLAGAYGLPAIIVGVSMGATQLDGYGNNRFCWLSVESGLFWAFAGPVLVIVTTNLIILVLVLKQLFGVSAMSKKTDADKIKTGVRSVCILLPVLGLTWVFGIFAVNKDTLVFQYFFAIFNSLQGFLIFLVQCVFDRKVRDALRQRKLPWFTSTDVRTGDTEMRSTQKST